MSRSEVEEMSAEQVLIDYKSEFQLAIRNDKNELWRELWRDLRLIFDIFEISESLIDLDAEEAISTIPHEKAREIASNLLAAIVENNDRSSKAWAAIERVTKNGRKGNSSSTSGS